MSEKISLDSSVFVYQCTMVLCRKHKSWHVKSLFLKLLKKCLSRKV